MVSIDGLRRVRRRADREIGVAVGNEGGTGIAMTGRGPVGVGHGRDRDREIEIESGSADSETIGRDRIQRSGGEIGRGAETGIETMIETEGETTREIEGETVIETEGETMIETEDETDRRVERENATMIANDDILTATSARGVVIGMHAAIAVALVPGHRIPVDGTGTIDEGRQTGQRAGSRIYTCRQRLEIAPGTHVRASSWPCPRSRYPLQPEQRLVRYASNKHSSRVAIGLEGALEKGGGEDMEHPLGDYVDAGTRADVQDRRITFCDSRDSRWKKTALSIARKRLGECSRQLGRAGAHVRD